MKRETAIIIIALMSVVCVIVLGVITACVFKSEQDKIIRDEAKQTPVIEESGKLPPEEIIPGKEIAPEEKTVPDVSAVSGKLSTLGGRCQWGVHMYNSGFSYKTESIKAPSASIIKVFIMEYAFSLIERGELSLESDWGYGSLKNLINSMITVSDNNSTNILIEYFSMENLNAFFVQKGYYDTVIERKMLDYEAMAAGKDNFTSLNDVMNFLDKVYMNKESFPYMDMLDIMKRQQRRNKIPSMLPGNVIVANKTGEIDGVENDIGIIFSEKGDFSVAFLLSSQSDAGMAQMSIGNCTLELYKMID